MARTVRVLYLVRLATKKSANGCVLDLLACIWTCMKGWGSEGFVALTVEAFIF